MGTSKEQEAQKDETSAQSNRAATHKVREEIDELIGIGAGVLGASPAMAMGMTYVASAFSLGCMFVGSVEAQRNLSVLAQDATVAGTHLLLGLPQTKRPQESSRELLIDLLREVLSEAEASKKAK